MIVKEIDEFKIFYIIDTTQIGKIEPFAIKEFHNSDNISQVCLNGEMVASLGISDFFYIDIIQFFSDVLEDRFYHFCSGVGKRRVPVIFSSSFISPSRSPSGLGGHPGI